MPFKSPPRTSSVLATMAAVGIVLTVASYHLTPLGPDAAAAMPQPLYLRSPLVLQAARVQPPTPAGGCPAGYVTLLGGPAAEARARATGTPVTFTSEAVSPVTPYQPKPSPATPQRAPPSCTSS